ncbi:MAG: type B 50S ribosomal protein L31 [Mollicutes bacterium PWAP]|nr:type B 50S ribosomal protein L31 [Mollicutes bacterium PWAP]
MKKDIHPEMREVAFKDVTSKKIFIFKSTVSSDETIEFEGKNYPLFIVDTSSESHPFYTGNFSQAKADGRVDKFNKKFGNFDN